MGINPAVEDEQGTKIATLEDPTNILHRVLPDHDDLSFRLLNYVDWYGDTTFNRLQVPEVRRELKRLMNGRGSPEEVEFLERVDELAAIVEGDVHLYLKFYGD